MNLAQTSVATSTSRKYRILTELGCGGMGRVYLAVHQGLAGFNKLVVLKVLRNDLASSSESRDSFLREARVSARMSHPNVVAVNEVEERDGVPMIVMEYLQGQPLSSLLRRLTGRVPLAVSLRILSDSLSGLHYAHELTDFDGSPLRLVHRDFTPQNIFVTYEGSVKVLDFGIAQVTRAKAHSRSNTIKGKLRYMAPEQINRAPLDRRTDVFAAGVVLCEIVTGLRFWGELSDAAIVRRIHSGRIPTPRSLCDACPLEVDRICAKALAYQREDRYQTIAEMQQDLERFITDNRLRITTQDLARELVTLFPDELRQAQQLIESHLSTDTYVSWSSIATASSEPRVSKTPPATATRTILDLPTCVTTRVPASVKPRGGFRIAGLAVGIVLLASGGFGLSMVNFPHVAPAPAAETATPVIRKASVRITAFPSTAAIFVDDQPVSHNPFAQEALADGSVHRLRVEAPGHVSVAQQLRFDRDIDLVVSLEAEEPSVLVSSLALEKKPASAVRPIRAPKPVPQISKANACSPPYTYDSRGLKHFKPECL